MTGFNIVGNLVLCFATLGTVRGESRAAKARTSYDLSVRLTVTPACGTRAPCVATRRKWFSDSLTKIGGIGPGDFHAPVDPALLALSGERFSTVDLHDHTVRTYALDGTLIYSTNPDSVRFVSITSLMDVGDHRLWLTDPAAQAVIQIDSSGRGVVRTRFVDAVTAAVPMPNSVVAWNWVTFASRYHENGSRIGPVAAPASENNVAKGARETEIARAPTGALVAGFRFSSDVMLYSPDAETVRLLRGVETVPFPSILSVKQPDFQVLRVSPRAVEGAESVAADRLHAYVLFAGSSANAHRIVDVYALDDGHYEGSFLLPRVASAIAADGKHFAVLYAQPFPHIVVYASAPRS